MQIGAQFYTVREFCKDLNGLSESLKKVADIGYKTVQISGVCGYEAEWMKEELRKNGLTCPITHPSPDRIKNDTLKVIEEHKTFGCPYIGLGYYNIKNLGTDSFIEEFREAAKVVKENGLALSYHNHADEFIKVNGKRMMDTFVEAFSPEELKFTIDTYWVQAGGADPVWWLEYLKGRTPCIHLKDMNYQDKATRPMAVIGEGNMNFPAILKTAIDCGVDYALVEQDDCNGENPFDCLKRSYEYLKAQGLE